MKRSFFLNKMLMISAFLCVVGCTQDTDISDSVIDETTTKRLSVDKTMEVLIEYVKGTSEVKKRNTRKKYVKMGLLLSWEKCKIKGNDNVEVWIINAIKFSTYRPSPITIPEKENMDKIIFNANCKDYKGKTKG